MKKKLSSEQSEELLEILKERFEENTNRHQNLEWTKIQTKIEANPEKLWSLSEMERTGGKPDVVAFDENTDEYIFYNCSPESPSERRSLCYDRAAWEARKKHKPESSAI